MVSVAGMLAAALSIACVSVQARSAEVFSTRLTRFSLVVAVLLLGAVAFVPILALLLWLIVVAITLTRAPTMRAPTGARAHPASETAGV